MAKFKRVPLHDKANFATIRRNPELAYFDRTSYILAMRDTLADALLFLRPRRFGKSLTVDMLECLHGVQYKDDYQMLFEVCSNTFFFFSPVFFIDFLAYYLQGLDIDEVLKAKKILPKEWLILRFDFSMLDRSEDPGLTQLSLRNCINDSIKTYCQVRYNSANKKRFLPNINSKGIQDLYYEICVWV